MCRWAAVFLLAGASPSCVAPRAGVERGAPARVVGPDAPVDAVAGRALLLPVNIEPRGFNADGVDRSEPLAGAVPVTLSDGRTLRGEAHQVRVRPPVGAGRAPWLDRPALWNARSASEISVAEAAAFDPAGDPGFWVVRVELPPDAPEGPIRVGGRRVELHWWESWRAPRPEPPAAAGAGDAMALDLLRPAAASPRDRWRLHLLAQRRAARVPSLAPLLNASLGDRVLDDLAMSLTDRWRIAISLVGEGDPATATRLMETLSRVVFDDGLVVPAWPPDEQGTTALLNRLLDPTRTPAQRAEQARLWLEESPSALAWVIDDAGGRSASSGLNPVRVGAANLTGDRVVASAATPDGRRGPQVVIPAHSLGVCVVAVEEREATEEVRAQVGESSIRLRVLAAPAPARPPGARLGPLSPVLTMRRWLTGIEASPEANWATGGLLMKDPAREAWRVYIECRLPPELLDSERPPDDLVRVWLGPSGDPTRILRVRADGRVNDELAFEDFSDAAVVRRERDRWTAMLPIPEDAIDEDRVLRIALERLDASGGRATWPRALLPWRDEPGRIAIDLTAWGELREQQ